MSKIQATVLHTTRAHQSPGRSCNVIDSEAIQHTWAIEAALLESSSVLLECVGQPQRSGRAIEVPNKVAKLDVSKDLAATNRTFHGSIRLIKSQTTHEVEIAIAKFLEKWLIVRVFPDQLEASSTAVAQSNAPPVVSELRNPTTPTNPHSTLTGLPLTVEQVVVQLLLDDLARLDKKPDGGSIVARRKKHKELRECCSYRRRVHQICEETELS